jgi:glycosyltransferase involved in cell wall biosynthesis
LSRAKIGLVVDGTDHFLRPIESELRAQYRVDRFKPRFVRLPLIGTRVNDLLLRRQLQQFIAYHDVTFFEWAGSLLVQASHLPKRGRIVTRLHSVELATTATHVHWAHVDTVVVLNEAIRHRLSALACVPLPDVAIVPNGVNLGRFHPEKRKFNYRLGMVCNLLPIKRVYEVLLTLYQLRQDGHPFTLRIAGKAGEGEAQRYVWAMQNLIAKLRLEEYVTFDGYVENVSSWLQTVDVFISNSYWEGQSMALIEAIASGCYCLSHCWDGVEEVLPAEQIFTTDSDLRAKLLAYAALPEADKQQAQARMRAVAEEKFDERRMVNDIFEIIQLMLKGVEPR